MPETDQLPEPDNDHPSTVDSTRSGSFDPRLAAIYATGALVLVLVAAVAFAFLDAHKTSSVAPQKGEISLDTNPGEFTATTLPNAGLVSMSGQVTDLPTLANGKPTIINMFSNACVACRQEMPALQKLHEQLGDSAQLIGVDLGDSHDVTASFIKTLGVSYHVVRDPTLLIPNRLGVSAQPFTIWVDKSGRITGHQYGAMTAAEMQSNLTKYLHITRPPA